MKLITCEFNMDSGCVEMRFDDGTVLDIDCTVCCHHGEGAGRDRIRRTVFAALRHDGSATGQGILSRSAASEKVRLEHLPLISNCCRRCPVFYNPAPRAAGQYCTAQCTSQWPHEALSTCRIH